MVEWLFSLSKSWLVGCLVGWLGGQVVVFSLQILVGWLGAWVLAWLLGCLFSWLGARWSAGCFFSPNLGWMVGALLNLRPMQSLPLSADISNAFHHFSLHALFLAF